MGSIPENLSVCLFRIEFIVISESDTDCSLHIRVLFIYVFPIVCVCVCVAQQPSWGLGRLTVVGP